MSSSFALAQTNDVELGDAKKRAELAGQLVKMENMVYKFTPDQAAKTTALYEASFERELALYKKYNFQNLEQINASKEYKLALKGIRDALVQKMKAVLTSEQFKQYQAAHNNDDLLK